jgi:hypothetical protein
MVGRDTSRPAAAGCHSQFRTGVRRPSRGTNEPHNFLSSGNRFPCILKLVHRTLIKLGASSCFGKLAALVCLSAAALLAQDSQEFGLITNTGNADPLWASADLNGDNVPDLILGHEAVRTGHNGNPGSVYLEIKLQGHKINLVSNTNPTKLPAGATLPFRRALDHRQRLSARDVDGDNDQDLVLQTYSAEPLAVWLNDGHGRFSPANLGDFLPRFAHPSSHKWSASTEPLPEWFDDGESVDALAPTAPDLAPYVDPVLLSIRGEAIFLSVDIRFFGSRGPPATL